MDLGTLTTVTMNRSWAVGRVFAFTVPLPAAQASATSSAANARRAGWCNEFVIPVFMFRFIAVPFIGIVCAFRAVSVCSAQTRSCPPQFAAHAHGGGVLFAGVFGLVITSFARGTKIF